MTAECELVLILSSFGLEMESVTMRTNEEEDDDAWALELEEELDLAGIRY